MSKLRITLGIAILVSLAVPIWLNNDAQQTHNDRSEDSENRFWHPSREPSEQNTRSSQINHTLERKLSDEEIRRLGGERYLRNKLNTIVLPVVDFENATIYEVLDFLRLRARDLDPAEDDARKGLGFIIRKPSIRQADEDVNHALDADDSLTQSHTDLKINIQGKNLTLGQVIEMICKQADLRMKIAEGKIALEPID